MPEQAESRIQVFTARVFRTRERTRVTLQLGLNGCFPVPEHRPTITTMSLSLPIHGRGASANPANRFDRIDIQPDPDAEIDPHEQPLPQTVYLRDSSRTIIATNESPDVMIEASINPYRGCEHGCVYCYARPTPICWREP